MTQDVAKRWKILVYLHVQSSCEEGPMPLAGAHFVFFHVMSCEECFCRCDWFCVVLPWHPSMKVAPARFFWEFRQLVSYDLSLGV